MLALTILNLVLLAQVERQEIPATHQTVYRVMDAKGCGVSWTLESTDLNRSVAQLRTNCEPALDTVISTSDQIIGAMERTDPGRFRTVDTLFLSGLLGLPEMRPRLALLAWSSGEWDPVRGRPKSGRIEALVRKYAERSGFLKGWKEMFLHHGVRIEVSGTEDAHIEKAGSLPFFDELRRKGVNANDLVPSTCLLWIRLIHAEKGNQQQ